MSKYLSLKEIEDTAKINGQLLTAIAKKTYEKISIDVDIMQLAIDTEEMIKKCGKHVASPMSIEVNNIVNNFAPMLPYKLTKDDIVSFALTLANDKSGVGIVKCAYSNSLSGLHDDIIEGINEACLAGIRVSGPDARFLDISKEIHDTLQSLGIATLTNICGHSLQNAKRVIPCVKYPSSNILNNYECIDAKMKVGETFSIEVFGTDAADDQEATIGYPTMYFVNRVESKRPPRLPSLRTLYQLISKKYQSNIFSLRDLQATLDNSYQGSNIRKYFFNKDNTMRQKYFDTQFRRLIKETYINSLYGAKLQQNQLTGNMNVVAHIGHSILITDKGCTILC